MEPILITTNISKVYKNRKALDNVNIKINRGDIYGLVGQNGAGKTTLIKLISGLAKSTSGRIEFNSLDLKKSGAAISFTLEKPGLINNLTAYEHMNAKALLYDCSKREIDYYLELVSLSSEANTKVKSFSMGMQQRLAIALALLGKPELVLFDEPINGLDPQGIRWFRELILKLNREKNITFMISSHILDELSFVCNKFCFIDCGKHLLTITKAELDYYCNLESLTIEDFYFDLLQNKSIKEEIA